MLVPLLEAALRSFALGGAVWLSLRFLRATRRPRMTARTVLLMAPLSMPVLTLGDGANPGIFVPTGRRDRISTHHRAPTALAVEFPLEKIDLRSAAQA